ncbi:MAG: endonuclease domain-containing protein [Ignavibacteria bacterium]|nr:endonuclease domain-containing protein [Ignavibacteria bacterium]
MKIFNRKNLKPRRKELRNNMTFAEVLLWNELKQSKLANRKFRRQQSIGYYIVDFYCPEEHLIIELDGKEHFTDKGKKYDEGRTKYLKSLSLKVLRFENNEVLLNMEYVLKRIKENFNSK